MASTTIATASWPAVSGSIKPSSMCNKHTCGGFADPSLHPRRIRNLVTKPWSVSLPGVGHTVLFLFRTTFMQGDLLASEPKQTESEQE